jgi:ABC-2 type transport system permease protein
MPRADALRRALKAFPSLLRVGVAEAVAYRAEFVVWLLTTTLPLVMLALWAEVARSGPVGSYSGADFTAYYLAAFVVRQLTGSWVAWDMNREIKEGLISMRLLRPLHPLVAYAAENLAVLPLRLALSLPVAVLALVISGRQHMTHDPVLMLLFPVAVGIGWALSFSVMAIIGALAFFIESTVLVFEIWFGLFSLCSGYLIPISLFPGWLAVTLRYLPFHAMLGLPVEIAIGQIGPAQAVQELALAGGYVLAAVAIAVALFQLGARRYSAYGA